MTAPILSVIPMFGKVSCAAYKHKNFAFKALEGLIKDTAAAPDMEEAQDVGEQNG